MLIKKKPLQNPERKTLKSPDDDDDDEKVCQQNKSTVMQGYVYSKTGKDSRQTKSWTSSPL
jgi:hypothetical protein